MIETMVLKDLKHLKKSDVVRLTIETGLDNSSDQWYIRLIMGTRVEWQGYIGSRRTSRTEAMAIAMQNYHEGHD